MNAIKYLFFSFFFFILNLSPAISKNNEDLFRQMASNLSDLSEKEVALGLADMFHFSLLIADDKENDKIIEEKKFQAFIDEYGDEILNNLILSQDQGNGNPSTPNLKDEINNYLLDAKALRELKRGEQFPLKHIKYLSEIIQAKIKMEKNMTEEKEKLFKIIKEKVSDGLKLYL